MKKVLASLAILCLTAASAQSSSDETPVTPAIRATINAQALKYGGVACNQGYKAQEISSKGFSEADLKAVYDDGVKKFRGVKGLVVKSSYKPGMFWIVGTIGAKVVYLSSTRDASMSRSYICANYKQ